MTLMRSVPSAGCITLTLLPSFCMERLRTAGHICHTSHHCAEHEFSACPGDAASWKHESLVTCPWSSRSAGTSTAALEPGMRPSLLSNCLSLSYDAAVHHTSAGRTPKVSRNTSSEPTALSPEPHVLQGWPKGVCMLLVLLV